MPTNRVWKLLVYHENERVFSGTVPRHRFERPGIEDLLRRLLSHFALTPDQIILASLNNRRGKPGRSEALDITVGRHSNGRILLECGAGMRSFATAIEAFSNEG